MKSAMQSFVLFVLVATAAASDVEKERTITKVVKLLQNMLDKSSTEGDEERTIYGKFKCYCDGAEAEKRASIKDAGTEIQFLEATIEEVQGDSGELSSDCSDLKDKMAENQESQAAATNIRKKENAAFKAESADLKKAAADMTAAIKNLAAVGADQTLGNNADSKQFMAGHKASLASLKTQVTQALTAASFFMNPEQKAHTSSFLQAPFTGTYSSQSTVVVGILKNMRDTFKANLDQAEMHEAQSLKAYTALAAELKDSFDEMEDSYEKKQKELGENDSKLASKRAQLAESNKKLAADSQFLDELVATYAQKTAGYENRKLMRANEDAAIAEAISILNSDEAFDNFGSVDATSKGATSKKAGLKFMQIAAVHQHVDALEQAKTQMQQVKSARVSKVLALLQASNPFDEVLREIDNMNGVISEEAKADKTKLDFCNEERKSSNSNIKKDKKDINALQEQIDKLEETISSAVSGILKQIADTEAALEQNRHSQAEETGERAEQNVQYQKDVKNLVQAESVLTKAIKVLSRYYDDLEAKIAAGEAALLQKVAGAPDAWKGGGAYGGQSKAGGDAIGMLEFIFKETKSEEFQAHQEEEKSQHAYEDSMQSLKDKEAKNQDTLAKLQDNIARAQKELLGAEEDLAATNADKESIEAYLTQLKPGCDFITKNFDLREKNRKTEGKSLQTASVAIKATPAYKQFQAQTLTESYGECKDVCVGDDQSAKCKACRADVTVPAYCAGHPKTKGC